MTEATAQAPALPEEAQPAQPSLLGRWRQALLELATGARLPFIGGADPDLPEEQAEKLRAQMRACLEAKGGEVRARPQAASIASAYLALSRIGKARFFEMLAGEFGVDRDAVERAIDDLRQAADEPARLSTERALRRALVTPGMRLLTKFNALPEGMRFLIDLRADLLGIKGSDPRLNALDGDFRHLLATWFDIGFLSRQRLTWEAPASLLQKIIEYEAVHEVRSWTDLRHRLDGDRRCYAFFHPSLPKDPLIFLQVALVEGLATQIWPLLDEERAQLDATRADTAIFYSITNTLYGLRGISFGNFLIKQVVDDLARDLPNLKQFATLSPIPGLRAWLLRQPLETLFSDEEIAILQELAPETSSPEDALRQPGWSADAEAARPLQRALTAAAARYLAERDREGHPIDPVARFHLGNGARIERIDWAADPSSSRLDQSFGVMVNYLYNPAEIEANHEAFASRKTITVSSEIADLLKRAPEAQLKLVRTSRRGTGLGRMIGRS